MYKKILHLLEGRTKQITDTEKVLQPLPHKDFRFANPFIVLHHGGPDIIEPGSENRIHPHPHRGFAPVTFALQGQSYHKDNAGHDQLMEAGEVQWMFAGSGLLHSEGPSDETHKNGGVSEFLQLWVNVPAKHKWDPPAYQHAKKEDMPAIFAQEGVSIKLASGQLDGQKGPISTYTPIITAFGDVAAQKGFTAVVPEGYWTLLYVAHGSIQINEDIRVPEHTLIVFEKENTSFQVLAEENTTLLLLSAEPLDEQVAAKDNFVMNTSEEIEQAMEDYRNGKFGQLAY